MSPRSCVFVVCVLSLVVVKVIPRPAALMSFEILLEMKILGLHPKLSCQSWLGGEAGRIPSSPVVQREEYIVEASLPDCGVGKGVEVLRQDAKKGGSQQVVSRGWAAPVVCVRGSFSVSLCFSLSLFFLSVSLSLRLSHLTALLRPSNRLDQAHPRLSPSLKSTSKGFPHICKTPAQQPRGSCAAESLGGGRAWLGLPSFLRHTDHVCSPPHPETYRHQRYRGSLPATAVKLGLL